MRIVLERDFPLVNSLYSNCSRSSYMKKSFDGSNSWFDNAYIRLKIASEELKQMQIEEAQRIKELQEEYGLTQEEVEEHIKRIRNRE